MARMTRMGAIIVLAGTITLVQAHGTVFWSSKLGPTGIAWSILLEATGLWLWSRPAIGCRLIGLCASLLLLLGPLYQVGTPILERLAAAEHSDSARVKAISLMEAEIRELQGQLAAFTENSQKRAGWLAAIEATQTRLSKARDKLTVLHREAPQDTVRIQAQETLVIGMEIAGLLLFQIAAVLAITTLAREAPMVKTTLPAFGVGLIGHWPADLAPETAAVAVKESASAKSMKTKEAKPNQAPIDCTEPTVARADNPTEAYTDNVIVPTELPRKNAKPNKAALGGRGNARMRGKREQNAKRQASNRVPDLHAVERI